MDNRVIYVVNSSYDGVIAAYTEKRRAILHAISDLVDTTTSGDEGRAIKFIADLIEKDFCEDIWVESTVLNC